MEELLPLAPGVNGEEFQSRFSYGKFGEFPRIREVNYGSITKSRSNFQLNHVSSSPIGPPDLLHYGLYVSTTSSQFNNDEFNAYIARNNKDDDGYIGYYHYVNGLNHNQHYSIENYIFSVMGIYYKNEMYHFDASDIFQENKRDLVVTYCTYNIFSRSDIKFRYVFTPVSLSKKTLLVDRSYQILPNDGLKSYSSSNFNKLPNSLWDEINVSLLIRIFNHLDDPSKQLTGLVTFNDFILTQSSILRVLSLLIKFLPRGYLTDCDPFYGVVTSCADKSNSKHPVRTSVYRNRLVDTIVRLCQLDVNGGYIDFAIKEVKKLQDNKDIGPWTYVIIKLLKLPNGDFNSTKFLNLTHTFFKENAIYSTQSCLIIIEQIKFLISKSDYQKALAMSQVTIKILPLDFECWYYLALSYSLMEDYEHALSTINSFPVTIQENVSNLVSGIPDEFAHTFIRNYNEHDEPIDEKTFLKYFPPPFAFINNVFEMNSETKSANGKIKTIWDDIFVFSPNSRHPFVGNEFYQSPLVCKSAKEISLVDSNIIKLVGMNSTKIKLAGYAANSPSSSLLDFNKKSTWSRSYDLLSFITAKIGWEQVDYYRSTLFNSDVIKKVQETNNKIITRCEGWLEQLFIAISQDLAGLYSINSPDRDQNHSVLEWEILGLLGWSVKYSLKTSIGSLITSVLNNDKFEINYFGSMQLLLIYDEFVLSELNDSQIDIYNDDYSKYSYTNKLIIKPNDRLFESFGKNMMDKYLTLDLVLLIILKLVSWNLRWYQYIPNYLINKILINLCKLHSPEFILSSFKIIFQQNKRKLTEPKYRLFSRKPKKLETNEIQFDVNDTIIEYVEDLMNWIDRIKT